MYLHHADWLGSERAHTNPTGAAAENGSAFSTATKGGC
jgi:hypothetical protein